MNIEIKCKDCGKPIVHSNEYGMFCEDWCGLEESKQASNIFDKLIGLMLGRPTDEPDGDYEETNDTNI